MLLLWYWHCKIISIVSFYHSLNVIIRFAVNQCSIKKNGSLEFGSSFLCVINYLVFTQYNTSIHIIFDAVKAKSRLMLICIKKKRKELFTNDFMTCFYDELCRFKNVLINLSFLFWRSAWVSTREGPQCHWGWNYSKPWLPQHISPEYSYSVAAGGSHRKFQDPADLWSALWPGGRRGRHLQVRD